MINTYRDRKRGEKATMIRSLNAATRGEPSQYELRQLGPNGFVGGPQGEIQERFPGKPIVAQWSAGYRV